MLFFFAFLFPKTLLTTTDPVQCHVKVQQLSDQERIKQLERENKELQRANEILRKAAAFFAQAELDRPHK